MFKLTEEFKIFLKLWLFKYSLQKYINNFLKLISGIMSNRKLLAKKFYNDEQSSSPSFQSCFLSPVTSLALDLRQGANIVTPCKRLSLNSTSSDISPICLEDSPLQSSTGSAILF